VPHHLFAYTHRNLYEILGKTMTAVLQLLGWKGSQILLLERAPLSLHIIRPWLNIFRSGRKQENIVQGAAKNKPTPKM